MNYHQAKPNLFIVGAPKCGTTFIYHYLNKSSEVYFPNKKSLNHFDQDLTYYKGRLSREQYLNQYTIPDYGNYKYFADTTVWYLYSRVAAYNIKEFNPDSKIIIIIRNPADMLYSQHSQFIYNGNEDVKDFEQALNLENEIRKGNYIPKHCMIRESLYYRDTAMFYNQVERYMECFDEDNDIMLLYDDLVSDAQSLMYQVYLYLNLDMREITFESMGVNPNKKIRSITVRNLLLSKKFLKMCNFFHLSYTQKIILRDKLRNINTKYIERQPLDEHVRMKINSGFKDEIDKLSLLLNRDLSHWYL